MGKSTMETKVGIVNLAEKEVTTERIEMFFNLDSLSEKWKEIVFESIEEKKQEWDEDYLNEQGIGWSDKGVDIDYMILSISLGEKDVTYAVIVGFTDKDDKNLNDDICVEVDLPELKAEVKKALLEKFF